MAVEKTAYRLTAQVNTLPFRQHFGQVAVVESGVFFASQDDRGGDGSHHRWPEDRGPKFVLLPAVGRKGILRCSR